MNILIQGAMNSEIEYYLENISNVEKININGYNFWKGNIEKNTIVISETKIGIINTSVATILGINLFTPDLVIIQGCAGGYGEVNIGDIVIGTSALNINSYKLDEFNNMKLFTFQTFEYGGYIEGELILSDSYYTDSIYNSICKSHKNNVFKGILGSGDCWNKSIEKINYLHDKYNVLSEDMETVATFKVCMDNNVKCVGARIISNNEVKKQAYNKECLLELQKLILKYIKEIE